VERVHTPNAGTIEQVSAFLGAPPDRFLKSLIYVTPAGPLLVVVRGDHEVNEIKLARMLEVDAVRLADPAEVRESTGAAVGFAGPVGFRGRILIDRDAAVIADGVSGANETDYHLKHVRMGRDFEAELADLRSVVDGDPCPACGKPLRLFRGIEAGHIFVLGTHYSKKMGATFLDPDGVSKPMVMGCYGIGVSRLVAAAVEQHNDSDGILWPMSIAPYQVHIVQLGGEPEVVETVARLERELTEAGIEVLVDDRQERPGVKFKDADLIGIPLRVTCGAKALAKGSVELKPRTEKNPKNAELVPVADAAETLARRVREQLGR
jgi:prolyl-tRNA synthetase